jgi:Circularly permutated YpsA SLOG family
MIPRRYPLRETPSREYAQRTWWNVRDADATLILYRHRLTGGTALTARVARTLARPLLVADLSRGPPVERIAGWIAAHRVRALNIAGPRESQSPGIYSAARTFLQALFSRLAAGTAGP